MLITDTSVLRCRQKRCFFEKFHELFRTPWENRNIWENSCPYTLKISPFPQILLTKRV